MTGTRAELIYTTALLAMVPMTVLMWHYGQIYLPKIVQLALVIVIVTATIYLYSQSMEHAD